MVSKLGRARGLTLIEVLLALVLLAALAGVSIGIFRDATTAANQSIHLERIDAVTQLADGLIQEHGETLGKLRTGQIWRPPVDGEFTEVIVTREPCDDCPEGWARLGISQAGVRLTRFHRVDPREEASQ